jgi:hypothetical protein
VKEFLGLIEEDVGSNPSASTQIKTHQIWWVFFYDLYFPPFLFLLQNCFCEKPFGLLHEIFFLYLTDHLDFIPFLGLLYPSVMKSSYESIFSIINSHSHNKEHFHPHHNCGIGSNHPHHKKDNLLNHYQNILHN